VVVLSHVLAHSCNIGYENCHNLVLQRVQGVAVRNLAHLQTLLAEADRDAAQSIVLDFANGAVVVLDRLAALAAAHQVSCRELLQLRSGAIHFTQPPVRYSLQIQEKHQLPQQFRSRC
jgi:hypothetical protein